MFRLAIKLVSIMTLISVAPVPAITLEQYASERLTKVILRKTKPGKASLTQIESALRKIRLAYNKLNTDDPLNRRITEVIYDNSHQWIEQDENNSTKWVRHINVGFILKADCATCPHNGYVILDPSTAHNRRSRRQLWDGDIFLPKTNKVRKQHQIEIRLSRNWAINNVKSLKPVG